MVHSLKRFDPQSSKGSVSDLTVWIYKDLRRSKLSKARSGGMRAFSERLACRFWPVLPEIETCYFRRLFRVDRRPQNMRLTKRNRRKTCRAEGPAKAEERKERTADGRRFTQITMILRLHSPPVRSGLFFSKD